MIRLALFLALLGSVLTLPLAAQLGPAPSTARLNPLSSPAETSASALNQPMLSPGVLQLLSLDQQFAKDVAIKGGKAFADWFADDAVTLSNGKAPVLGRTNITRDANWDPKEYQLSWETEGAQMGPSNDMGFTWGHYTEHFKDKNGEEHNGSGRYITVWKKLPDGTWKVAMDGSANAAPPVGSCCSLPTP